METTIEIKIAWKDKDTGKSRQQTAKHKFNGDFGEAEKIVKPLEADILAANQKFQLPLNHKN